jgi:erythromycin esterase-like protein
MPEYGRQVASGQRRSCAEPAVAQFRELHDRVSREGPGARPVEEALVSAWQSARVVMNGEAYYRAIFAGGSTSWNLRDRHMADTLDALAAHVDRAASGPPKVVVWAHNSHVGDARVTERSKLGELNLGQLMRERHEDRSVLVGFTTHSGTVLAASSWGAAPRAHRLRPARSDSFSALFHETGAPAFLLPLRGSAEVLEALPERRLERFVGVVYAPYTERQSHYFETNLARQFDAVIHIDRTSAVQPLADP